MNRLLPLVLWFAFAIPLSAETFSQCLNNCLPGVNDCSNCCDAQFQTATQPCNQNCSAGQNDCFNAAYQQCQQSGEAMQTCMPRVAAPCYAAVYACQRVCENTVQIAGGCPGEMLPQSCPFNCQTWNSASRSCIGPAMNMCPPPPPQPCPYNCQSWNPLSQSCIGPAMNGCSNNATAAEPVAASMAATATQLPCGYDCQTYDPAKGECVGPAQNGCELAVARASATAAKAAEATKKTKTKKRR